MNEAYEKVNDFELSAIQIDVEKATGTNDVVTADSAKSFETQLLLRSPVLEPRTEEDNRPSDKPEPLLEPLTESVPLTEHAPLAEPFSLAEPTTLDRAETVKGAASAEPTSLSETVTSNEQAPVAESPVAEKKAKTELSADAPDSNDEEFEYTVSDMLVALFLVLANFMLLLYINMEWIMNVRLDNISEKASAAYDQLLTLQWRELQLRAELDVVTAEMQLIEYYQEHAISINTTL